MLIGKKIRLLPTADQIILFKKSMGVMRFSYNFMITQNNNRDKFINQSEIRKLITKMKKTDEYKWLNEVSSNIPKQACKDCQRAFENFFNKKQGYPQFKKKFKNDSFYVNYESFKRVQNGCHIEKIGTVRTSEIIPKAKKYYNPRVIFDGKYYYIAFSIDVENQNVVLNDKVIGIDLGIKTFVVTSDNEHFENINKSNRIRKLIKSIKKTQKKLSRCEKRSKNRRKVLKKLKLLHRTVKNIRLNYIHQITRSIVNKFPKRIIVEYLKVSNMLKNRKLSKVISEAGFYKFRQVLEYKSKMVGIDFVIADSFYPSSKLCSNCGNKKEKLTLKDRVYTCDVCGLVMDRDYNASLNLTKY